MSIDYLAIKNAHIRDKNISFEEEGHKYTVNGGQIIHRLQRGFILYLKISMLIKLLQI